MEGDMKEIVLERLEQRLKEKDEELHSLKKQLEAPDGGENLAGIMAKVDTLETDVRETQMTLSEVMKKVGALETAMNSMLMSLADDGESDTEEELSVPPLDSMNDGHKDDDALRFFHLSRNA